MPTPTREERLRPLELLGIAGAMAAFCGLAVLLSTRNWFTALIFAAVAFIVSLLVMSTIAITGKPTQAELDELKAPEDEGGAEKDARH